MLNTVIFDFNFNERIARLNSIFFFFWINEKLFHVVGLNYKLLHIVSKWIQKKWRYVSLLIKIKIYKYIKLKKEKKKRKEKGVAVGWHLEEWLFKPPVSHPRGGREWCTTTPRHLWGGSQARPKRVVGSHFFF
jgi:hypothetical protein